MASLNEQVRIMKYARKLQAQMSGRLRRGQALWLAVDAFAPQFARQVAHTAADPYYNNAQIGAFWSAWADYKNTGRVKCLEG